MLLDGHFTRSVAEQVGVSSDLLYRGLKKTTAHTRPPGSLWNFSFVKLSPCYSQMPTTKGKISKLGATVWIPNGPFLTNEQRAQIKKFEQGSDGGVEQAVTLLSICWDPVVYTKLFLAYYTNFNQIL